MITNTTQIIKEYIKQKYDIDAKYLWIKYPNYSVFKHSNNKWFGVLMNIPVKKLCLDSNEFADVINLKCDQFVADIIKDNLRIFPAYHMNKEKWISVLLDINTDINQVYYLIDQSYNLTKK